MGRVQKIPTASAILSPIHLYGWDSRGQIWHGPNELGHCAPDKRLLQSLSAAPGSSWYGTVNCCCAASEPGGRFFVLVHDLPDCAMAAIYCDESKAGPAEILAIIPGDRRARVREEFAFEFLSFARFLGSISAGAELEVHEAITAALSNEPPSTDCIFSISSGVLSGDLDLLVSRCAERIAVTLCWWMADGAAPVKRGGRG